VFLGRRKRRTSRAAEPLGARDERAYALLEAARLQCEAVRERAASDTQWQALHRVHRQIGLAGLLASSRIPTSTRQALLAHAHAGAAGGGRDWRDPLRGLVAAVTAAEEAVQRADVPRELSDHMHLAQGHLREARELLVRDVIDGDRAAPEAHEHPGEGSTAHGRPRPRAREQQRPRDDRRHERNR
jgi:hypothetical protein